MNHGRIGWERKRREIVESTPHGRRGVLIYILDLRLDHRKLDLVFSFVLRREIMAIALRKAFELPRHLLGPGQSGG